MAGFNFNFGTVAPQVAFAPIPPDWYYAKIVESELKPNSKNNGTILSLQFEILGGKYAGRKVFANFNVENPNPQTVEIAFAQLSAIAHAVGQVQIQDTQQLHEKPMKIKVKMSKTTEQYPDPRNEFAGAESLQGETAVGNGEGKTVPTTTPAPSNFGANPQGGGQPQGGFAAVTQNSAQGQAGFAQGSQGTATQGFNQQSTQGFSGQQNGGNPAANQSASNAGVQAGFNPNQGQQTSASAGSSTGQNFDPNQQQIANGAQTAGATANQNVTTAANNSGAADTRPPWERG